MSNLREEYLDFKELRESKIKSLITDLSKRNKGISRENLLKMLSRKESTEYKDANFFQILDFLVDKNIKKMTQTDIPTNIIADTAYQGAFKEDEMGYSPQNIDIVSNNIVEETLHTMGFNNTSEENNPQITTREINGGGERPSSFRITLNDEIPNNEEDPFLHRSGMLRIIDDYENYEEYLDSDEAYLNNRKNIYLEKNIPKFLSITFNQDFSNESATQHFSYGRFVLKGAYFFGYRTPKNLFLIPMNFGWILLRVRKTNINLLSYCSKNMEEKDCSPLGNTFDEFPVWKTVQLNDGFVIAESDTEQNDGLIKAMPLKSIKTRKLNDWQHIPDLPKFITVTLRNYNEITFTYDKIQINADNYTFGYTDGNNLYIISYNNIFYIFEIPGEFPSTLEPKMVIFQGLISPDPINNVLGYSLDFEGNEWYEKHPDFDFDFTDLRIGRSAIYHSFERIEDIEAVSTEVRDYFSSLETENLYKLFEMNQCHFEGTSLELIFDNVSVNPDIGTYGERFFFRKIDFNLSKDISYKDIYTCYCYVNTYVPFREGEKTYIDANNCSFYKFIFLYKQHWVLFKLSDMYRDDKIFIEKATPLYLCPGGSSSVNFSYEEWIKLGDPSMPKFQPLYPVDDNGEVEDPIRFSYDDVREDRLLPQITDEDIIDRHGMERVDLNNSEPEQTDEYIDQLLDSFMGKGDGENILIEEKIPKRNELLTYLKIFKKDYATDKNKQFFYILQYIASIFNFKEKKIGIKNISENFDEEILTMFLKKVRVDTITFKDKNDMEMGIDAGGLRPEFFRDMVYEFKKTFLQMITEKEKRETKDMMSFEKIQSYVEKKLREVRNNSKPLPKVTRNNTAILNTNNFFRSKKTRNLYQSVIRTRLANNKRRKQEGKPLTKTQKQLIKKKVGKRMEKYNRNVASLNRRPKSRKKPSRTLSAPSRLEYGSNKNDFTQFCDLDVSNFTLRKYKNNPFKKLGLSIEIAYFLGGIFFGKMITNDNGSGVDLQIFPNVQMSYFFLYRLLKQEDYLNSWLDILSVCKMDMPEIYDTFKYWDESWNDTGYSIWDDDLPIPKEYYKYLGGPKDISSIKREMKRFGKNDRFNSYVPDPKFKLSLFLLYVIEKYERGLEEEYYYFMRGMRQMVNLDLEFLQKIGSLDLMFTGGTIDVELLISKIQFYHSGHSGVTEDDVNNIETWLIEMIREVDIAEDSEFLKKLLYFWSSSYNVSETGQYKVNIMDKEFGDESMVVSHTCSKELDIHKYSSKDIMVEKLRTSVLHGQEGFGFA